jgi:hypothetical protein
MPARKQAPETPIYQLKVTLAGVRPPVWRRLQVSGETTLAELHRVIQAAVGWTDSHLHLFETEGGRYSHLGWGLEDVKDEGVTRLREVAPGPKSRLYYEYDFGDSWEHEILLEKVTAREPGASYPRCVAGRRACPPEDCGGVWGYENFLEAVRDPEHPEHEETLEWAGGEFDPEAFDLEEVNRELQRLAAKPARKGRRG